MLTDVKAWLGTTGMEVEEVLFLKPPGLPYIVFSEERNHKGPDNKNCIVDRNISVEFYSEIIDSEAESKIEALLNERSINFKKNRVWINEQLLFSTIYDFSFTEKI